MKYWMNSIKQENYLFFRSSLIKIHLFIPLLGIILMNLYFSKASQENILYFMMVVSLVFPFAIGIVCAISSSMEWESGDLHRLKDYPGKRAIPYFAKFLSLLFFGYLSLWITIAGFTVIQLRMNPEEIDFLVLFISIGILWLTAIPVYLIEYIVSFRFGSIIAIAGGIIGSLIAGLMETGLGDGLWMYSIWGAGIRLLEINSLPYKTKLNFAGEINGCILFTVILSIFLIIVLGFFASRFEGETEKEE